MKQKAAKLVVIICAVIGFTAFGFGISFYYRDLPHTPQPQLGRIYPLNNHGQPLYMTHREKLQQEVSFGLFAVLLVGAALIEHFLDRYDRATLTPRGMAPWRHRRGP